jgi:5'-methylthioadenosine phosphorylase
MKDGYTLAVLGGSGLYEMDGLEERSEIRVETPFGKPSDAVIRGKLGSTTLLFLPRHGRGHMTPPHAINYRANICALKMSGATHLLSVSAVGSMKEEIAPGDLVVADQYIDLTKKRASTFFDDGCVAHVAFADPVCGDLAKALHGAATRSAATKSPSSSSRRHVRVHRRAAIFDARREPRLSIVGRVGDRDDRDARSKARA